MRGVVRGYVWLQLARPDLLWLQLAVCPVQNWQHWLAVNGFGECLPFHEGWIENVPIDMGRPIEYDATLRLGSSLVLLAPLRILAQQSSTQSVLFPTMYCIISGYLFNSLHMLSQAKSWIKPIVGMCLTKPRQLYNSLASIDCPWASEPTSNRWLGGPRKLSSLDSKDSIGYQESWRSASDHWQNATRWYIYIMSWNFGRGHWSTFKSDPDALRTMPRFWWSMWGSACKRPLLQLMMAARWVSSSIYGV